MAPLNGRSRANGTNTCKGPGGESGVKGCYPSVGPARGGQYRNKSPTPSSVQQASPYGSRALLRTRTRSYMTSGRRAGITAYFYACDLSMTCNPIPGRCFDQKNPHGRSQVCKWGGGRAGGGVRRGSNFDSAPIPSTSRSAPTHWLSERLFCLDMLLTYDGGKSK